jgi:hypothetical protein
MPVSTPSRWPLCVRRGIGVSLPKHSLTVIARAHDRRNLIEYEGKDSVDEKFLAELIAAGNALEKLLPNP